MELEEDTSDEEIAEDEFEDKAHATTQAITKFKRAIKSLSPPDSRI